MDEFSVMVRSAFSAQVRLPILFYYLSVRIVIAVAIFVASAFQVRGVGLEFLELQVG